MFDLTQGSVGKTLTKMTTFTTLGMVSILGFALADAYYVGLLGKTISQVFPIVYRHSCLPPASESVWALAVRPFS